MVAQALLLDSIFGSLSDSTRRDILKRVARSELSVGEIAKSYRLTFAAISKHLKVLEKAKLVVKHRRGKEQVVTIVPATIQDASAFLKTYEQMWNDRLDSLEQYLSSVPKR